MATRVIPNSATVGDITGDVYMDAVAAGFTTLFNAMALVPTSITNTGNDYTMIIDPPLTAGMIAGMGFYIRPNADGTGPVQLRVTSGGTYYPVVKSGGEALDADEWNSDTVYFVVFISGEFRILSVAQQASSSGGAVVQQTIYDVSGTWTKPSGLNVDAIIEVEVWGGGGAGGGNGSGGGGGGGGYNVKRFKASDLTSTVAVTVGAGGTYGVNGVSGKGGDSSFGAYVSAFGGGGSWAGYGDAGTGGGGGATTAGGSSTAASNAGAAGTGGYPGAGGDASSVGGNGYWGGGGGGSVSSSSGSAGFDGGLSMFGGGGGAGFSGNGTIRTGGISVYGGKGGNSNQPGTAPGGGGGGSGGAGGGPGGAGRVIVRIVG